MIFFFLTCNSHAEIKSNSRVLFQALTDDLGKIVGLMLILFPLVNNSSASYRHISLSLFLFVCPRFPLHQYPPSH